jgi:hypothetical protein
MCRNIHHTAITNECSSQRQHPTCAARLLVQQRCATVQRAQDSKTKRHTIRRSNVQRRNIQGTEAPETRWKCNVGGRATYAALISFHSTGTLGSLPSRYPLMVPKWPAEHDIPRHPPPTSVSWSSLVLPGPPWSSLVLPGPHWSFLTNSLPAETKIDCTQRSR